MRILVLGGTGAMGEPLVKLLGNQANEVYVTSRRKRESDENVHFIQGDAHDLSFIQQELNKTYDVIVDFMIYSTENFMERVKIYLESSKQYIFLSSARVYADSQEPITENSPRLLDVCKDEDYLRTDEYALAKARSENILFNSEKKNWTIIRPYITYNTRRLQLGGLELETWLMTALSGRPLVLPKDVGIHETTMTYGDDVAKAMVALIGNQNAYGEAFNIVGTDHMKWSQIAETYCDVIEKETGYHPDIYAPETSNQLSAIIGNIPQIKYDRSYDRVFDNTKLLSICRKRLSLIPMREGLRYCLKGYLDFFDKVQIRHRNIPYMAYIDKATGRRASMHNLYSNNEKLKYLGYYYAPRVMNGIKEIKRSIKNKY